MKVKIVTLGDIKKNQKIVLWGAGVYVEEVMGLLGEKRIVAIIDNSPQKWGTKVKNLRVQSPMEVMEKLDKEKAIFLISIASHNYEIATDLHEKWGVNPEHIFCFTHKFAEKYMYDIDSIQSNSQEIKDAMELLSDTESKVLYQNLIKAKLSRNPFLLKENKKIIGNYVYKSGKDEICVRKGNTILDCGAFIGDTAKIFMKDTQEQCKIYCFEPLEGNYQKLKDWVTANKYGEQVVCIQALLDEKEGKTIITSFQESSVQASMVQEGMFKNEVMIKTIDSCVNEKVDFIKMDIEGSELKALIGAQKLIKKFKPQMVISAYHRTSHLWEIPKLIKKIEPSYKIYLGHQPNAAFEPEYYVTV